MLGVVPGPDGFDAFCDGSKTVAVVEVSATKGSTPRETGAFMLVSASGTFGTIGGGQLEFIAIAKARLLLDGRLAANGLVSNDRVPRPKEVILEVPLGPEIGQCCGGRVAVSIRMVDDAIRREFAARATAERRALPTILVFGGGHVGLALASALVLLPARTIVVETRAEALHGMPPGIETRLTPMPESLVREAPAGSAFVILTHDHALDFMIAAEALKRPDAAYVGMIGSKTKKATFRNWFLRNAGGTNPEFQRLVSPIGGDRIRDKRPAVIAALAGAEIISALWSHQEAYAASKAKSQPTVG